MGKALADVIIVADTSRVNLLNMTRRCVESCWVSEIDEYLNIIVIDGNKKTPGFEKAVTYTYDFKFNYNRCLNVGLQMSEAPYVAMCNNDLIFHNQWLTKCIKAMGTKYHSCSPWNHYCRGLAVKEGYGVKREVLGWCLVAKRSLINKIDSLDEDCDFWYSDNIYIEQVKRTGLTHCLVYGAHVTPLGSKTLIGGRRNSQALTRAQRQKFDDYLKRQEAVNNFLS